MNTNGVCVCLSFSAPGLALVWRVQTPARCFLRTPARGRRGSLARALSRPPTARRIPPTSPRSIVASNSVHPLLACTPVSFLTTRSASGIRVIAPDAELPVPLGGSPGSPAQAQNHRARVSGHPVTFPQVRRTGRRRAASRESRGRPALGQSGLCRQGRGRWRSPPLPFGKQGQRLQRRSCEFPWGEGCGR